MLVSAQFGAVVDVVVRSIAFGVVVVVARTTTVEV